jgi:hypothetical protein
MLAPAATGLLVLLLALAGQIRLDDVAFLVIAGLTTITAISARFDFRALAASRTARDRLECALSVARAEAEKDAS